MNDKIFATGVGITIIPPNNNEIDQGLTALREAISHLEDAKNETSESKTALVKKAQSQIGTALKHIEIEIIDMRGGAQ